MACARLSNVAGGDDLAHQLSQTYASLPPWAKEKLFHIDKDLVLHPAAHGAKVYEGPSGATLTTLWLANEDPTSADEVFVAVFLASATATGTGQRRRHRRVTHGADALPGTLRETPLSAEEQRAQVAAYKPGALDASDEDTSNWFTEVFRALVGAHQPEYLHLSSNRRMIRAFRFMAQMQQTLVDHVHRVVDSSGRETDPRTTEGHLDFYFQGLFSATDRDNLVQAQVGGKLVRSRDNHVTITHAALPPGWRRDSGSTRAVLDEAAAPLVRLLIHAMGYESQDTLRHVLRTSKLVSPMLSPVRRWTWDPESVEALLREWSLPKPDAPAPRVTSQDGDRLIVDGRSLDTYRLDRWLSAWESCVLEWETRVPKGAFVNVPGIRHWEEESGDTVALLRAELPSPAEPFASEDDLRRARAAVDRWIEKGRKHGEVISAAKSRGTLPLLGEVSGYRDGDFEYRLISGHLKLGGKAQPGYELRRRPCTGDRVAWRWGTGEVGELCGTVAAADLHRAVADIATEMLRARVRPRTDGEMEADYAPVKPLFRRRRMGAADPLARESQALTAAEAARTLAYDMLSEPPIGDPAAYRANIRQRLEKAEAEIEAVRSRIAMIEKSRSSEATAAPDDLAAPSNSAFASELQGLLLVIDRLRGAPLVDPQFASGLQEVLRVRVERTEVQRVHFDVEIAVPGESGSVLILQGGHGTAPIRGWALPPQQGEAPPKSRAESARRRSEARSAEIVEQIMARGSDFVSLLPTWNWMDGPASAQGQQIRLAGAAHLARLAQEHGYLLTPKVASVAMRNPIADVRRAIWSAIHGDVAPPNLDEAFATFVARAYLGVGAAQDWYDGPVLAVRRGDASTWAYQHEPTAAVMRMLASAQDYSAPGSKISETILATGGYPNLVNHLLVARPTTVPLLERKPCLLEGCRANCRKHRRLGLRPCPHAGCAGRLDTPARIFEVPDGVLCSTCRRMPDALSPVFPMPYLDACERRDEDLLRYAPDVLAQRAAGRRKHAQRDHQRTADATTGPDTSVA